MEINVETILGIITQEEKELLSILSCLGQKESKPSNNKIYNEISKTAKKNIRYFDKLNHDLSEFHRSIRIHNIEIQDYRTPIPKKKQKQILTVLLFVVKSIKNSTKLCKILNESINTKLVNDVIPSLIDEKEYLRKQVEKIYDDYIMNQS